MAQTTQQDSQSEQPAQTTSSASDAPTDHFSQIFNGALVGLFVAGIAGLVVMYATINRLEERVDSLTLTSSEVALLKTRVALSSEQIPNVERKQVTFSFTNQSVQAIKIDTRDNKDSVARLQAIVGELRERVAALEAVRATQPANK